MIKEILQKLTTEQSHKLLDNLCVECGLPVHENLRKCVIFECLVEVLGKFMLAFWRYLTVVL